MKQKVKSNFEEKMEQNLKKCYEKKIEKYKIAHVKSIEKQYDKDLIDYDALFKSLTKWA